MRMNKTAFFYILRKIRPRLPKKQKTNIIPEHRLMLTLRFLSTGLSFRALAYSFRISNQTVAVIIYQTCEAIWDTLKNIHMPSPTVQRFKQTAEEFERQCGFP
uniref:Transposase Helix-turn-helix domain-containing protein n=1 Tax=Anopheles dirus TaxID=7168 RepID=A0A182NT37_9DIPT